MKRRGAGEGAVFKRRDGRWVAALTIGTDAQGRQRRRTFYAATRREVEEKLRRARGSLLDGTLGDVVRTRFGDFLDWWLADAAKPRLREMTLAFYEGLIRNHIRPHMGGVSMSRLTGAHVQGLLAALERDGSSPRQRQQVLQVLRRALGDAVRWGLLRRNPAKDVERPRSSRPQMRTVSRTTCAVYVQQGAGTSTRRSSSSRLEPVPARANSSDSSGATTIRMRERSRSSAASRAWAAGSP
ncbi:MAG TPA: hypothetical protein VKM54_16085 [Myxococcota bacterium]|nr:hypothetical protein [Myxococcota bacterium]